jgi:hypothetical protein
VLPTLEPKGMDEGVVGWYAVAGMKTKNDSKGHILFLL